nr:MAG TPA: hypothetical protein [Caudoviricetes sp.]
MKISVFLLKNRLTGKSSFVILTVSKGWVIKD